MLGSLIQRLSLATPPCRHSRASGNPVLHPSFKRAFLDVCFRRHDTGLLMHQADVRGCPCQGRSWVTSVSIVLLLLLCPALVAAQSVFAAASLSSALSELTTHYEGMRLSVASSSTLAKQIAAGAPADIYFSANAEWMDYLQTRQHIEQDTRVDLLGNTLVVIAPREEPFAVRFARDFAFAGAFARPLGPRRSRSRPGWSVRPSSPRGVGLVVGTQNPHRTRARRPRRLSVCRARRVRRWLGVRHRCSSKRPRNNSSGPCRTHCTAPSSIQRPSSKDAPVRRSATCWHFLARTQPPASSANTALPFGANQRVQR